MARKVKKTIISGELRTTEFEDGTKLHEQLFDAVLTDGNILKTIRNSEGIKSYEMNVIAELPNGNKTKEFKAMMYASLKESAKFETDPFVADARIRLAVSKAKSKDGEIKIYSRIELPPEITANDVFNDDMFKEFFSDEISESGESVGLESDPEVKKDLMDSLNDKKLDLISQIENGMLYNIQLFLKNNPSYIKDPILGPMKILENMSDSLDNFKESMVKNKNKFDLTTEEIEFIASKAFERVNNQVFEKSENSDSENSDSENFINDELNHQSNQEFIKNKKPEKFQKLSKDFKNFDDALLQVMGSSNFSKTVDNKTEIYYSIPHVNKSNSFDTYELIRAKNGGAVFLISTVVGFKKVIQTNSEIIYNNLPSKEWVNIIHPILMEHITKDEYLSVKFAKPSSGCLGLMVMFSFIIILLFILEGIAEFDVL